MHKVERLKNRWTPARFEARMWRRERRALQHRNPARNVVHIPAAEERSPMDAAISGGFMAALATLALGRRFRFRKRAAA